jgi:hypothetical protein
MLRAATIRGLVKATVPEVVLGIALPADDVTVDLDSEFPDELGGIDNEEGAGLAVDGEVTATASPARPNAVADRIRAQLLENVQNLAPAVAAGVRDHMRNLQMPPIAHADFTKADAALVRRLIDECEAEQERIDSGYPVPDAVQDAQPEANYTEPGSEKYDPADAGIEGGEPFTEEEA